MAGARKNAPPREEVLAAAMRMIAERGLEQLTMAALGREVGMSSGHLLYYFHSKDELLLQTLEWSEEQAGRGARTPAHPYGLRAPTPGRLRRPVHSRRPPRPALDALAGGLEPLAERRRRGPRPAGRHRGRAWHRDLVALLAEGVSRGEFRPVDPDRFATRLRALLDGFSIHVAIGLRGTDRAQVLGHVRELVEESLLADA
ncbi:TetR/AcrR family transcriptional regulator [Streptomyces sp. L7]